MVHPCATSCMVDHFYLEPTHYKAQKRLVLTFFETAAHSHIYRLYDKTYCLGTATGEQAHIKNLPFLFLLTLEPCLQTNTNNNTVSLNIPATEFGTSCVISSFHANCELLLPREEYIVAVCSLLRQKVISLY